jgi:hypothetical protein
MQTKSKQRSHKGALEIKFESPFKSTTSHRPVRGRSVAGTKKPNSTKAKPRLQRFETDLELQISPSATTAAKAEAGSREPLTRVEAKIDVGFGNALFIRGQGQGLSWDKGLPLSTVDATTWKWSTTEAKDQLSFKLLVNDQVWAKGDDVVVEAGKSIQLAPVF